ncbi:MAG: ParA family protein [Campylobacterales bacterium]|nr:ParA family protein [Campylobacterales bacterium]
MELLNTNVAANRLNISRATILQRVENKTMVSLTFQTKKLKKHFIPSDFLHINPQKIEFHDCKVISIIQNKGGVGKSSLAINFASSLSLISSKKARILIVDFDPQANLSENFLSQNILSNKPTIADIMRLHKENRELVTKDVVLNSISTVEFENVKYDILPSSIDLGIEIESLRTKTTPETRLNRTLKLIEEFYDFIIIDTPPTVGLYTQMALNCSDDILLIAIPEEFPARGFKTLLEQLELYKNEMIDLKDSKDFNIFGLVINKIENTNLNKHYKDVLVELSFKAGIDNLYFIPKLLTMSESQAFHIPIFEYKQECDMGFKIGGEILKIAFDYLVKNGIIKED